MYQCVECEDNIAAFDSNVCDKCLEKAPKEYFEIKNLNRIVCNRCNDSFKTVAAYAGHACGRF